jgi:hypothetical protein
MKLRNKKTGEIIEFDAILPVKDVAGDSVAHLEYGSLAELNEEWTDAPEEPKEYWFIDYDGGIIPFSKMKETATDRMMKQIGNYFETKEEAESVIRKLEAWKRLKDTYHIRFVLDFVENTISFTYRINDTLHSAVDEERIVFEDMKTFFGGEE